MCTGHTQQLALKSPGAGFGKHNLGLKIVLGMVDINRSNPILIGVLFVCTGHTQQLAGKFPGAGFEKTTWV